MARDKIHNAVKNALIKDGWTITHDPYEFAWKKVFARQAIEDVRQQRGLALIVVNIEHEEVVTWIE